MKECGCATRAHTITTYDGMHLAYGWSAICAKHWNRYMSQSRNDAQLALDIFSKECKDEADNERQRAIDFIETEQDCDCEGADHYCR
jgi:hypothetical protein